MTHRLMTTIATLATLTLFSACGSGSNVTYEAAAIGCAGHSAAYVPDPRGLPMRCGPQEQSPWERPR